jgi:hypothetical protein
VQITVNHVGNIEEQLAGLTSSIENELTNAMSTVIADLQGVLRYDTGRAGLGPRVIGAWGKKLYFSKKSAEPSGLVYSKAPKIIAALSDGAIIRAKKKSWLAIPLPTAGMGPRIRGNIQVRMTPEVFEHENNVELQFVSVHGGQYALLVMKGRLVKKGKRFGPDFRTAGSITKKQFSVFAQYGGNVVAAPPRKTRTGATARTGVTTIPVFVLVHTVTPPKLLDLVKRADEFQRVLASAVATAVAVAAVPKLGKV